MLPKVAHRQFYSFHKNYIKSDCVVDPEDEPEIADKTKLLELIEQNIIGSDTTFASPFGTRKSELTLQ